MVGTQQMGGDKTFADSSFIIVARIASCYNEYMKYRQKLMGGY